MQPYTSRHIFLQTFIGVPAFAENFDGTEIMICYMYT
jgi:hypothetical protein